MIIVMNLSILSCGGRQRQAKVLTLLPCSQTLYFLFNARRALPWVPETFLARFPVSVNTENSRRTQEPLRASFSRFLRRSSSLRRHASTNTRLRVFECHLCLILVRQRKVLVLSRKNFSVIWYVKKFIKGKLRTHATSGANMYGSCIGMQ